VVKAAIAYVISPSVTAEHPERLLDQVALQSQDLPANRSLILFASCDNLFRNSPGGLCVILFGNPLIECCHGLRCKSVTEALLHQALNPVSDLRCSQPDAKAILSVVFEQ